MDNQNLLSSIEQLKIDNGSVVTLQPKNNSKNNNNNNNSNRHNSNRHNSSSNNRNNNQRHNSNNNNNRYNNNRNHNNRNHSYNEDEDPELLLAFEISKAEYEEQQRKTKPDNNTSTSTTINNTTTTTTTTGLNNSNLQQQQQQTLDSIRKGKKGQSIDMTHLLKFQSTSPHHRSPYINSSSTSSSSHINSNSYRPPRNSYRSNNNNNSSSSNNNNNSNNNSSSNNSSSNSHHHHHHHSNKNKTYNKNKKPIQDSTFLQANYLFKINPFGNYQNSLREVDSIVSWNKVEQVVYLTNEDTQFQCPICLDNPVIPKITKCGHILCYCCILRSLAHTNKCPLCLLPIESKQDLKSLEVKRTKKFKDGDEITLQLIKYQEGSTVPFISTQVIPEKISFPYQDQSNCIFSRFSIVNSIDDIIDKEMEQLIHSRETALSECESESLKFLTEASSNIQDRQDSFKKLVDSRYSEGSTYITILKNSNSSSGGNKKEFDSYQCSNNFEIRMALEEYFNSNDQDYVTPDDSSDNDNDNDDSSITSGLSTSTNSSNNSISTILPSPNTTTTTTTSNNNNNNNNNENIKVPLSTLGSNNNNNNQNNKSSNIESSLESFSYEDQPSNGQFYLYQSNDGQKIYLHPLCMKILDYEYKKANTLPSTIKAKVYEFEDYQVTEQSRKQYKSFNVLALTTGIVFAEIDLTSVVSKETLQHFHKEIKQRKDSRFNKKRKEQRIQRGKEIERAKDLERALELREISRKEKQLEMEREALRLEQEKKDREEQLKNSANQKVKRQLGFLEAIQTHKNIDSPDEFPSLK